jgi:hypothetical protein
VYASRRSSSDTLNWLQWMGNLLVWGKP